MRVNIGQSGEVYANAGVGVFDNGCKLVNSGILDSVGTSVKVDAKDFTFVNHGFVFSDYESYFSYASVLRETVINDGKIDSRGLQFGGAEILIENREGGLISASEEPLTFLNDESVARIVYAGKIEATGADHIAIDGDSGRQIVVNSGEIVGDLRLEDRHDRYVGRGGTVDGEIDAGAGNDRVIGGQSGDLIVGGGGNDRLTGGYGFDAFIFRSYEANGDDVITDFDAVGGSGSQDYIHVETLDFEMHKSGKDVVIDFANGDSITLLDVRFSQLAQEDFVLI